MVNVTKINKLFPTVVHEFQYIADDNLTKAIKNEDLETKIINHTSSSVDNNLQKRKEYKPAGGTGVGTRILTGLAKDWKRLKVQKGKAFGT